MRKHSISAIASTIIFLIPSTATRAETTELPNVQHHWLANTGGNRETHVQNFLTDLAVYYWYQFTDEQNPLIITASTWDEGSCGFCAYAHGKTIGKAEWWQDLIHSDTARFDSLGLKCNIGNLWGRSFLGHGGPPPTGNSAPFVACTTPSTTDTLRSVEDPTALAFDRSGNLLVADNGPDQNVKIFSTSPFKLMRTFGDSGGVFATPRPGSQATSNLPGATGTRRFWGIRGLGVDRQGNVYVGNTGIPMQTMGGTDIRAFSATDSSLLWQLQGLAFVNNADADPASDGKDLYLNAKRFRMDYEQTPGKSWKHTGVTLDPFRFPLDPRLVIPNESVWERRIEGKRFQFHTGMVGGFVNVVRFEDSSEIGIPTAFFCTYEDLHDPTWWVADSFPKWERNEANKRLRWYWVDKNGDGIPQKSEFHTWENWNTGAQGLDIDEKGNIWIGGMGDTSAYFRDGGITMLPIGKLDQNGVPGFPMDSIRRWSVPFSENRGSVIRLKHLVNNDAAFLATGSTSWYSTAIHIYKSFSTPSQRQEVCRIDLGYDARGETEIHLDQNTSQMTLPFSFTADSQYVYVAYLDNGRYSRRRGEVTVYSASTCEPVGWMAPDSAEGFMAGAMDLVNAINVAVQSDGTRVVMLEEDGAGKVLAYRWKPVVRKPSGNSSLRLVQGTLRTRWDGNVLRLEGLTQGSWNRARLMDAQGRIRNEWDISSLPSSEIALSLPAGRGTQSGILLLQGPEGKLAVGVPPNF